MAMYRKIETFVVDDVGSEPRDNIDLFAWCQNNQKNIPGNEFIVIDNFGCSPSANWSLNELTGGTEIFLNIRINSSDLFLEPDGQQSRGVPGIAAPYPNGIVERKFIFSPNLYALPGQHLQLLLSYGRLKFSERTQQHEIRAFLSCMIYSNAHEKIASTLLSYGIAVTPENVNWYINKKWEQKGHKNVFVTLEAINNGDA